MEIIDSQCLITNSNDFKHNVPVSKFKLLTTFKKINNLLRQAGLRNGYERFSVLADLIFVKLNECLNNFKTKYWSELLQRATNEQKIQHYYDEVVKPQLCQKYGNIFEVALNVKNDKTLSQVIKEIEQIDFCNLDTDFKGDALEFFLKSITNGNKDLGEYYTPRHIVKMIVKLLNPVYGEKIYDPCCGTGGFLTECFKWIKQNNISKTDFKNIIYGKELTTTARIAKMNMILLGNENAKIEQKDCLVEPIDEKFDIVVSNIPYSQTTEYKTSCDYPTKNGDSLFVQHMWKATKKGGKMAVVVPDPFLYSEKPSIMYIRQKILNECYKCTIISLPRETFYPYTPTKTSVLIACKNTKIPKPKTLTHLDKISYYIIRNNNFRQKTKKGINPEQLINDCSSIECCNNKNLKIKSNEKEVMFATVANNNYNLFPFAYIEHIPKYKGQEELENIGKYITERNEKFNLKKIQNLDEECVILSITQNGIYPGEYLSANKLMNLTQTYKRVEAGDIVYSPPRINIGSIGIVPNIAKNMYISNLYVDFYINDINKLPPYYLLKLLKSKEYQTIIDDYCLGGARANLKFEQLRKIKIKLPAPEDAQKIIEQSVKMEHLYQEFLTLYKQLIN